MKKNIKDFINSLGGSLEVAYRLSVHQVTVEQWIKRNRIPDKYIKLIKGLFRNEQKSP